MMYEIIVRILLKNAFNLLIHLFITINAAVKCNEIKLYFPVYVALVNE